MSSALTTGVALEPLAAGGVVRARRWRGLLGPGVAAIRVYWAPFLLLQILAALLVVGYFEVDAVRSACARLAAVREAGGVWFCAAASAFAGAILPELAKAVTARVGGRRNRVTLRDLLFNIVVFAVNGVLTDTLYHVLAWAYGSDNHWGTVAKKALTDQFVTTPIYGVAWFVLVYTWRAHGYRVGRVWAELDAGWYGRCVVPLLIPCWCFWLPMVFLIYALPGPLQFCLNAAALSAWSLLLLFMANGKSNEQRATNNEQ